MVLHVVGAPGEDDIGLARLLVEEEKDRGRRRSGLRKTRGR